MVQNGVRGQADAGALAALLADTVPTTARTVLQIGKGVGWLAPLLRERLPTPIVHGVEPLPVPDSPTAPGSDARAALGEYFELDLDRDAPPLEPGSVDHIVYADVLSRLVDPLAVLKRHVPLLSHSGTISCSVPNLQHHSVVSGILRGVFPYAPGTLLEPSYLRFFTSASIMQLLLDAAYLPDTVARIEDDGAELVATAGAPLFELLGVGAGDAQRDLRTSRLIVRGTPLPDLGSPEVVPVTFVACVNDDEQLGANLARSPCLTGTSPHELLVFRGAANAAEGLNAGIEQAHNELVVLVHQDVYLPEGWPERMVAQWRLAEKAGGVLGIAGVFGVLDRRVPFDAIGRVVHRDRLLSHRALPSDVDGLDELLMIVPRDTPLRVDGDLGWHLYGTDLALQAQEKGLRAVVIDAPCHHNSLTGRVPWKYRESERVLARKWEVLLPIHTNLSSIGSWLIDGADTPDPTPLRNDGLAEDDVPDRTGPASPAIAELVTRLRREQVALNAELEQARLKVASMQASPFWRAREVYADIRRRLSRR
jgi:hypothetical protein